MNPKTSLYFLIGMPGSGKSTLGKDLAFMLSLDYIDLDEYIEEREGQAIPSIFEAFGQNYFRQKETEAIKGIISNYSNAVVSTGGGAPCFNKNMELINLSGTSIFIDVSQEELFKRLKSGKQNRPLVAGLSDDELYNKLSSMRAERLPFYNQAHLHLRGDTLTPSDIYNLLKEKP